MTLATSPRWSRRALSSSAPEREDPLTPAAAYDPARERLEAAYAEAGYPERLRLLRVPGAGHEETPEMRRQVFDLLGLSCNND